MKAHTAAVTAMPKHTCNPPENGIELETVFVSIRTANTVKPIVIRITEINKTYNVKFCYKVKTSSSTISLFYLFVNRIFKLRKRIL